MRTALNTTLTTNEFYALLALTDKTLHGYGLRDQIAFDSAGSVVVAQGAIYPLLARLQTKQLIERIEAPDRPQLGGRYRITALGRSRLQAEAKRLERVAMHARQKLAVQI